MSKSVIFIFKNYANLLLTLLPQMTIFWLFWPKIVENDLKSCERHPTWPGKARGGKIKPLEPFWSSNFIEKVDFCPFYAILLVDSSQNFRRYLNKILFYLFMKKAETFTSILDLLKEYAVKISAFISFIKIATKCPLVARGSLGARVLKSSEKS